MSWRDLACRRRLQALERVGLNRGWFRELSAYYRGLTMQEFWVRYTLLRMEAAKLWDRKPREGEADYDPGGANLLESASQREATVAYLDHHLIAEVPLGPDEWYARYHKPPA